MKTHRVHRQQSDPPGHHIQDKKPQKHIKKQLHQHPVIMENEESLPLYNNNHDPSTFMSVETSSTSTSSVTQFASSLKVPRLADLSTDSARERLRVENLTQLEHAFEEEAPLSYKQQQQEHDDVGDEDEDYEPEDLVKTPIRTTTLPSNVICKENTMEETEEDYGVEGEEKEENLKEPQKRKKDPPVELHNYGDPPQELADTTPLEQQNEYTYSSSANHLRANNNSETIHRREEKDEMMMNEEGGDIDQELHSHVTPLAGNTSTNHSMSGTYHHDGRVDIDHIDILEEENDRLDDNDDEHYELEQQHTIMDGLEPLYESHPNIHHHNDEELDEDLEKLIREEEQNFEQSHNGGTPGVRFEKDDQQVPSNDDDSDAAADPFFNAHNPESTPNDNDDFNNSNNDPEQASSSQYPPPPASTFSNNTNTQNPPERKLPPYIPKTPQGRWCLGAVIVILAAIGLAIGMIVPGGIGSRDRGDVDIFADCVYGNETICSLVPSSAPSSPPTFVLNAIGTLYANVAEILIENNITDPETLSTICYNPRCRVGGSPIRNNYRELQESITIQQKALDVCFFQDTHFFNFIWRDESVTEEILIQRYIVNLVGLSLAAEDWDHHNGWIERNSDECSWYGIGCIEMDFFDPNDNSTDTQNTTRSISVVNEISLDKNNLKGTMPNELMKLKHLETLSLWNNPIYGSMNEGIASLTSLRNLILEETKFINGTVPTEIGLLTQLETIYLGDNELEGEIPSEIGNLPNLRSLSLHGNNLNGTIPGEIVKDCTELKRLFIDSNKLTGSIPPFIGLLTQLQDFRAHNNSLSGQLPNTMKSLSKLETLYLDRNSFTGSLGSWVDGWEMIEKFEAWDNQFTGTIPRELFALKKLNVISLYNNQFSSTLSQDVCKATDARSLIKLDLSNNTSIEGPLPNNLANCENLETLKLSDNEMTGRLPSFLGNLPKLKTLYLNGNRFRGAIPIELSDAENLTKLKLHDNLLSGVITKELCETKSILSADCFRGAPINCVCCTCCKDCS